MLSDFVQQVIGKPTILIGNSIGSLACTIVAAGKFLRLFYWLNINCSSLVILRKNLQKCVSWVLLLHASGESVSVIAIESFL